MASLVIITGENAGNHYHLTNRPLTAGRDPARDIQLIDPKVSRKHFQVRKDGDGYILVEMKSRNGVYVNGEKVSEKPLVDGDEIQAGDTVLRYYESDIGDRTDALHKYKRATPELREDQTIRE